MRRLMIAMAVLVAACSTSPTLTAPTTAPPDEPGLVSDERLFVAFLREWSADQPHLTMIDQSTDAELIELGEVTCEHFSLGGTARSLFDIAVDAFDGDQLLLDESATITGASVALLCPEHYDDLADEGVLP